MCRAYQLIIIPLMLLFVINGFSKSDKRPNILFAISDDQSYAHTGFEGCEFVKTPAFDRIAREGVYFSNCYAGSPGCAPSRSSIVTGRYPWQNEQSGQHASSWLKKYVPFVDELEVNGYAVGRTGKGVDPFRYKMDENDSLFRIENAAGKEHSHITYSKKADDRTAKGINSVNYYNNFKYFMEEIKGDKPFFFWYGSKEPHRGYEKDSYIRNKKKLTEATIPDFLPDNDVIRGDLLDYAVEIEWFDLHLQRMLEYLEQIGELENTIVIVTSDNGMPFPRAKANTYNHGAHVPLTIRYPKQFKSNVIIDEPATFIDLAPTILQITQTEPKYMQPISGKSMIKMLETGKSKKNRVVYSGRERHSYARHQNLGYPQRAIRKGNLLLIWNMKPERWPAGDPQAYDKIDTSKLLAIGKGGSFADIDGSPSKTNIIANKMLNDSDVFFRWATEKRPEFELFDLKKDPACLFNQIEKKEYQKQAKQMKKRLIERLTETKDPRVVGPDKDIFDSYIRYSSHRKYPKLNNK